MFCEYCNNEHDGSFGSGRFCSKSCSRGFSTKHKRQDINIKVSKKLIGRTFSPEHIQNLKNGWHKTTRVYKRASINDILVFNSPVSKQHIKRRLIEDNIKEYVCEECGINSWNNKKLILQLHHKDGNNKNNILENLSLLCPNCHSQTNNYAGRNRNKAT